MPHIEVLPNAKEAAAPGWAYVPDTGVDPSKAALNPTHPRRARNTAGAASGFELSARQLNAVQKRLAELDRDNTKEIAVPKSGDGAGQGRGTRGKQTTAVKRILQSHKTFANHLSDEEAMLALQQQQQQQQPQQGPTTNADLPTPASASITTSTSPSTTDPSVPRPPSPSTLASLLAAPPLSYAAARTKPRTGAGAPPQRKFCDMCGYWGRVRCGKCGGRVCGLECRDAHEESGGCYRF